MDDEKLITNIEEMIKSSGIILEHETIYDFLKKSFPEINSSFKKSLHNQREYLKPVEGIQSNRLFFYAITLIGYAEGFYTVQQKSDNQIVKTNADLLRREITENVIAEISPYFVSLFKWDLDRRRWKRDTDKFAYLKRVVKELDEELKGQKDNLLKKYVCLLIDYFVNQLDVGLTNGNESDFKELKIKKEDIAKIRNRLKAFSESDKINEFVDEELESSLSSIYKPMVQIFFDGIRKQTARFDYLITAFIQAQNEYKNLVSGILESITNRELSNIKQALLDKNISQFISIIQSIFASIPNELIKNNSEAYYHINIHVILKAIGCEIVSEVSTNMGRIDSVIEFENCIYIIEYKLTTSSVAMQQIIDKKYYESYLNKNKKICLLGLAFDTSLRNLQKEYSYEEIN